MTDNHRETYTGATGKVEVINREFVHPHQNGVKITAKLYHRGAFVSTIEILETSARLRHGRIGRMTTVSERDSLNSVYADGTPLGREGQEWGDVVQTAINADELSFNDDTKMVIA